MLLVSDLALPTIKSKAQRRKFAELFVEGKITPVAVMIALPVARPVMVKRAVLWRLA